MEYFHASSVTFPETALKAIDWCSQAKNGKQTDEIVSVSFADQEVYLYPESEKDLEQIYFFLDLTKYTDLVCNMNHSEFVEKFPNPVDKYRNLFDTATAT